MQFGSGTLATHLFPQSGGSASGVNGTVTASGAVKVPFTPGARTTSRAGAPIVVLDLGDGPVQAGQVADGCVQLLIVVFSPRLP